MPRPLIDIAPLALALEQDCLLLTPNSRIKNKLTQAYNQHQQELGHKEWVSPRVYSLNEWVMEQYQSLLDGGLIAAPRALISELQLQQLWQQVLQNNTEGLELINPLKLSSDANSAFSTLLRWQMTPAEVSPENHQQEQFVLWATEINELLANKRLATLEQLIETLIAALGQGQLAREPQLITLDFGELTPLNEALLDAIAEQREARYSSAKATLSCELRSYPDRESEAAAACLWAKIQLQANPDATIGIIAPNLGSDRELILRHLTETFESHALLPESSRYTLPFNFSTGIPLGSTPLIQNTLALLKLNTKTWDVSKLIELLYSPFWGEETDLEYLDKLVNLLKRSGRSQIELSRFRQLCQSLAEKLDSDFGRQLSNSLQQTTDIKRRSLAQLPPSRWVDVFLTQLDSLNWPGARRLDSNEYQQSQQWYQLLENFCRLDEIQGTIGCYEALDLLAGMASSTPFQAQTRESPIQVLGALEASGLIFDHCWVLGMSAREWPPAPQPNPLLPLLLQRQTGMPHADANRELAYAEQLTKGYQRCAETVIFSYPAQGEEGHQQPSPLLKDLSNQGHSLTDCSPWQSALRQQQSWSALEPYDISSAPPLSDDERGHVRGGSQILRNQAINPMAAFLTHRLGASQPVEPAMGFTPQQRGQLLHETLANVWQELKQQHQLLQTSDQQLHDTVFNEVKRQAQDFQRREPQIFGDHYLNLEITRQTRLILQWLDQEKQRPGFTVVATEQQISTELAGLPLTLRLDRLDQLASGELVIIDYKMGKPAIKSWGSDRPEEPQLPLYALSYHAQIQALMFVQINTSEVKALGIGHLSDYHEGLVQPEQGPKHQLPDTWEAMLEHWNGQLQNLSREFQQGNTAPVFKSASLERFYEHLLPILRPQELTALSELDAPLAASAQEQHPTGADQ